MAEKDIKEQEAVTVTSTTEKTPHPADETSAPGPYEGLDVNRPPVSTNRPDVPIAQTLVGGAGAPQPYEGVPPEEYVAPNAYVQKGDNVVPVDAPSNEGK